MNEVEGENLPYKLCEHIKDNGVRCGGAALSGEVYCRFHVRARTTMSATDAMYELPILETEQSVQIALQQLTRALLTGQLSERKAAVMMSAIKTAANLIRMTNQSASREALLNEIASELRGRLATRQANRKAVQSVRSDANESPAAAG
ncbi:MAG: hypothetical protein ACXVZX_12315 [Terriglobales bacterium]